MNEQNRVQQKKRMSEQESNQLVGVKRSANASGIGDETDNNEPPSKLNHDCFESVFEWLSLTELLKIRRTCKQMKQMVDFYIKFNYSQVTRSAVYTNQHLLALGEASSDCFQWIKHLYISRLEWTATCIESIQYILNELESLDLNMVKVDGDFYELILKHCPKLKHLTVVTKSLPQTIIGTGNEWLFREYSSLKHFGIKLDNLPSQRQDGLAFFELFIFLKA